VVSTEGLDGQEQYAMKVVEKKKLNESMLAAAAAEQGIMSAIKKMEHPYILKAFFSFFARKYFRLEPHSNPIFNPVLTSFNPYFHPILKLHWAFEHRDKLHLVLDFCVNDLFGVLAHVKRFSPAKAQLYAAQLASALHEIHSMGFIHCDLKLENILVDEDGHTMLGDFGFTQRVLEVGDEDDNIPQGHTICYTPPEVLNGDRVEPTTDWWGLGCLIYEYHHGLPPYYHNTTRKTIKAIHSGVIPASPHIEAGSPTWDIVEKLLVQDPELRVGGAKGPSYADVQAHPYFAGMDWVRLQARELPVPD
jgi:serine/threonine-protein kinase Psk1